MTTQRVSAGIPGLDSLLYGGFLQGDAVLVAGAPGTGKSTLGMHFLYEGITHYDEPGFFITFEEFPQQIYRDALNFGWDFRRLEEEGKLKVIFTSPDLMYQDIKRHEGIFPEMIRETGAKRVVVDSITHFHRLASDPGELREVIYSLINALKREGLTPLLLQELTEGEKPGTVAEEYTTDSVIHLTMDRVRGQRMRFIEVLKSRGTRHIPARSLFYINDSGIEVVPPYQDAIFLYKESISVGIPQLDGLLGGGIPYGSFYLFEVNSELHQEVLELNYLAEANRVGDYAFNLVPSVTRAKKQGQQAEHLGLGEELAKAEVNGSQLTFVINSTEDIPDVLTRMDEAFQQTSQKRHGRILLDITRLLMTVNEDTFFTTLATIQVMVQRYDGVCLGFLNPTAVSEYARQKLLTEADGITRFWMEGSYSFMQVLKTVNSVRTPICAVQETSEAPFMQIMTY